MNSTKGSGEHFFTMSSSEAGFLGVKGNAYYFSLFENGY